jgi:3-isopropylmalate/(R)-2-methylmalate dehydratase large subunit
VIAEVPYALPGEILVCIDSHTCSAGALNCAARGIGPAEMVFVLAKGRTWFQVGETIRYELSGVLREGVAPKDVFLHLASVFGDHVGRNVEFGGPALATLSIDARRTLTTMCAELSAEFALCEPDDVLERHLVERGRGRTIDGAVRPDSDAAYEFVRALELDSIEPMVSRPHTLIHNAWPVGELAGTRVTRAFIGSCANGTLTDLREAAGVLAGRRVDPGVILLVTPASQDVYRRALREGVIETLMDAGAVVTASSCGMCAGFEGNLGRGDVCIASSTRNFRGRMGSVDAEIYLASSATVAASAVAGQITGAHELSGAAVGARS